MSLRNYAEIRKLGRQQTCPRLSTPSIDVITPTLSLLSTRSPSAPVRPLLLVTGTQIQRNETAAVGPVRWPSTRSCQHNYSNRAIVGLNGDVHLQLPRLDDATAAEETICSARISDCLRTNGPITTSKLSSVSPRRHQRFETDDIADDHSSAMPAFKQDRCSLRRLDSANTLEHEHLRGSFNVRNFSPKIKSSPKGKPAPFKRLSSFPDVTVPRDSSGLVELRLNRDEQQRIGQDAVSLPLSLLKEAETSAFIGCCKVEGNKSRDADGEKDTCCKCSPCSKLQEGSDHKINLTEATILRVRQPLPESFGSDDVPVTEQNQSQNDCSQGDYSQEIAAMAAAKMSEAFHSVWPELLHCLIEECLNNFENMDQHMKQCMAELLADDSESHPSS